MATFPFVDLGTQQRRIRRQIEERMERVLEHGQYILGPEVAELENLLAAFVGCRHTVTVASGTDALLVPLIGLRVGPGDAVFVPSFTFTATAEVPLLLGATPVFVDVDRDTYNIDCRHLREQIEATRHKGTLRPSAIIGVDLFGLPAHWNALEAIAQEYGLFLIDDAAQSLGATIGGSRIGTRADVTATSFFPAKPFGAYGDGGAIFTDDDQLAELYRSIRAHGQGQNRYDTVRVGLNGRLDTLQAAVLLAKLEIFEEELQEREAVASRYDRLLDQHVRLPPRIEGYASSWAQYTIQVHYRDDVRAALAASGVPTAVYYPAPMHLQPAYQELGDGPGSCPVSEALCSEVLSLPMHPYLSDENAGLVCDELVSAIAP